jgi:hypothetical protein
MRALLAQKRNYVSWQLPDQQHGELVGVLAIDRVAVPRGFPMRCSPSDVSAQEDPEDLAHAGRGAESREQFSAAVDADFLED